MGADSPHSKTIFIRAPRAITLMSQIGGQAPPSGQNEKWTKVQNFWTPFSQKRLVRISPKFLCGKGSWRSVDMQIMGKIVRREKSQDEIFENFVGEPWPPNYAEYSDLAWLVCGGHRPLSYGTRHLAQGPVVSEKLGVKEKPLAPPSVETGSRSVTWLDMSTGVDRIYVLWKFEDIRSTRFGVMEIQSFGRIAPQTKISDSWREYACAQGYKSKDDRVDK